MLPIETFIQRSRARIKLSKKPMSPETFIRHSCARLKSSKAKVHAFRSAGQSVLSTPTARDSIKPSDDKELDSKSSLRKYDDEKKIASCGKRKMDDADHHQQEQTLDCSFEAKKPKYVKFDNITWRDHLLNFYQCKYAAKQLGKSRSQKWYVEDILKLPQIRKGFNQRWTQFGGKDFLVRGYPPNHPEVVAALIHAIPDDGNIPLTGLPNPAGNEARNESNESDESLENDLDSRQATSRGRSLESTRTESSNRNPDFYPSPVTFIRRSRARLISSKARIQACRPLSPQTFPTEAQHYFLAEHNRKALSTSLSLSRKPAIISDRPSTAQGDGKTKDSALAVAKGTGTNIGDEEHPDSTKKKRTVTFKSEPELVKVPQTEQVSPRGDPKSEFIESALPTPTQFIKNSLARLSSSQAYIRAYDLTGKSKLMDQAIGISHHIQPLPEANRSRTLMIGSDALTNQNGLDHMDNATWRKYLFDFYHKNYSVKTKGSPSSEKWYVENIMKKPHLLQSFRERWKFFREHEFLQRNIKPDDPLITEALKKICPQRCRSVSFEATKNSGSTNISEQKDDLEIEDKESDARALLNLSKKQTTFLSDTSDTEPETLLI